MRGYQRLGAVLRGEVRQDTALAPSLACSSAVSAHGLRLATICLAFGLLAGCASSAPPTTFDLDPTLTADHVKQSRQQLSIAEPTATQPLSSRRILIRTGADTIAYLHGGQWSTDLPRLVQNRLIDGFASAHVLRAVGGEAFFADRGLHTDIVHFEYDVAHSQAVVEIDAKLSDGHGRVIAEKVFTATASGANDHVPTVAAAINTAFAAAIHEIVIWVARHA
ncbi:MAG TPA: ABC-type transport auxiliary lipoprotein family protein [Methylovirgula sp.]|jgi:cholesterol transport system auxiliary component|nr:ABC-type transport auxiliary lipoprotein family protein [Methylovirgula sp.]